MADNLAHPYNQRRVLTIDVLPDDVLLEIFDFYVFKFQDLDFHSNHSMKSRGTRRIESWQSLVHVCRRWRGLVFESPRRLNLQLFCVPRTPARKILDVWPALPLLIQGYVSKMTVDNVIAVLEHSDRLCTIDLACQSARRIEKLRTAMEMPFPELEGLYLSFGGSSYVSAFPDSFLSGSASRLRYLELDAIPFPGLPKLLLSATHLTYLGLHNIPRSGYISPEAMATCLSMLTSLKTLQLEFEYRRYPDLKIQRSLPPTRFVLPALTNFRFSGVNEYLKEFVARIDAPQLSSTTFFDNIDFDTPELNRFIGRKLTLVAYDEAHLIFRHYVPLVRLRQSHPEPSDHGMFEVTILGRISDRQLSTVANICTFSLRLLLTIKNLYIEVDVYSAQFWRDKIENTSWLDVLLSFTAVKNLYISKSSSPRIARTLQELTEARITEVLPTLQNIFLEGFRPSKPVHEGIARFISARQLTDHPVSISAWDTIVAWEFENL